MALPVLRRLRQRLRPPRRLRLRRPGLFVLVGAVLLGLASLNTGNNLLYLLLGALLGIVALSGWLSEQAIRDVRVRRVLPRAATAGASARMEYLLQRGGRLPAYGLVVRERSPQPGVHFGEAWVPEMGPASSASVRSTVTAPRRGIYPLQGLVLSTAFPFGLFDKERDLDLPGSLVVWPRTDGEVRRPRVGGGGAARRHVGAGAAAGAARGDYRGLREYRPGDDPRDIHWRSSARRGEPILRQYERDATDAYWIVLDSAAADEASGEAAVEAAASLFAAGLWRGDRVGLATSAALLPPGAPGTTLERGLDALAGVRMGGPAAGVPPVPAAPASCVLVTAGAAAGDWGDVITAAAPVSE